MDIFPHPKTAGVVALHCAKNKFQRSTSAAHESTLPGKISPLTELHVILPVAVVVVTVVVGVVESDTECCITTTSIDSQYKARCGSVIVVFVITDSKKISCFEESSKVVLSPTVTYH